MEVPTVLSPPILQQEISAPPVPTVTQLVSTIALLVTLVSSRVLTKLLLAILARRVITASVDLLEL